jgi:hypothetical protein
MAALAADLGVRRTMVCRMRVMCLVLLLLVTAGCRGPANDAAHRDALSGRILADDGGRGARCLV